MNLNEVQIECDHTLQDLERLFKPHCRLTLLMRNPEAEDGDMILTRDDLGAVIDSIERFQKRELERPATEKEAMRAALTVIMGEVCASLAFDTVHTKALRRIARSVAGGMAGIENGAADDWLNGYLAKQQYPADLLDGEV